MTTVRVRRLLLASLAALAGLLAGLSCKGEVRKPVFPVKGQVFVRQKPAAGALVVFRPVTAETEKEGWSSGYPRARVQEDGSFQLATYGKDDGAPEGEYLVLIEWRDPSQGEGSEIDLLQGIYSDPKNPRLRCKVEPKPNEVPPYRIN
jgi:hypothetical protein